MDGIVSRKGNVPYEAGKYGKTKKIEKKAEGGVAEMVEETI